MKETYRFDIEFTEPLLGTMPLNKAVFDTRIATKAPTPELAEEEAACIEEVDEKGVTGFHRTDQGIPCLFDYHVKGFMKDACSMLRRVIGMKSNRLTAYKKIIDGLVFVVPRKIEIATSKDITILERPLRAQTMQGERVAIARSEMIEAGATMTFTVIVLGEVTEIILREWFDYGALRGMGSWRNASWGRFAYEMTKFPVLES